MKSSLSPAEWVSSWPQFALLCDASGRLTASSFQAKSQIKADTDKLQEIFGNELYSFFIHYTSTPEQTDIPGKVHLEGYEWTIQRSGADRYLLTRVPHTDEKYPEGEWLRGSGFLKALLDSTPNLIFVKDIRGNFRMVNQATAELFGVSEKDLIMKPNAEVHKEKGETLVYSENDQYVFKNGKPLRIEERFTRPDGTVIIFDTLKAPLDLPGSERLILGISIDITELKLASERSYLNQLRLQEALRMANSGSWEHNLTNNDLHWSPENFYIWGRKPEDGTPELESAYEQILEEDRERVRKTVDAISKSKKTGTVDYRITTSAGIRNIHSRIRVRVNDQGEAVMLIGINTDVTEQVKNEERIRQNESRLMEAEILARSGWWEFDVRQSKIAWSPGVFKIWKRDPSIGAPSFQEFMMMIPSVEREAFLMKTEEIYASLPEFEMEYRVYNDEGELINILSRGKVYRDELGNPLRTVGSITDITYQKRTERLLRESEQRLREALRMANLGSWEYELESGRIIWSEGTKRIFGWPLDSEAPSYEQYLSMIHPDDRDELVQILKNSLASGESYEFEHRAINALGELHYLKGNGKVVLNEIGQVKGLYGIVIDVTDRKEFEHTLIDAKHASDKLIRSQEYFLANITHELRTPLNGILGMARLIQKTQLNPVQRNYMDTLARTAENLLVIINDILEISKIESGTLTLENIPFQPWKIAETAVQAQLFRADEKDIQLRHMRSDEQDIMVFGDPYRLNQILLNLLSNAIKFTNTGEVILRHKLEWLSEDDVVIEFSVQDTGIGIPSDQLEIIFERFTQYQEGENPSLGGTGLGLAISKNLVESQGGEIGVESVQGKGSTFYFSIPYKVADVSATDATSARVLDPRRFTTTRILLAEDNKVNLFITEAMLRDWGFHVDVVENGPDALDMVRQNRYDLVLMDIQMPGLSGVEVTRLIREMKDPIKSNLPIIALTANNSRVSQKDFRENGMTDILLKPVHEDQLLRKILHYLPAGSDVMETLGRRRFPARKRPIPSADQLYDLGLLRSEANSHPEFVIRMLRIFLDTIPQAVQRMKFHFARGEMDTVSTIAHGIKPALDGSGIVSLREVIRNIENYREKKRSREQLESEINRLEEVIAAVCIAFEKEIEERTKKLYSS